MRAANHKVKMLRTRRPDPLIRMNHVESFLFGLLKRLDAASTSIDHSLNHLFQLRVVPASYSGAIRTVRNCESPGSAISGQRHVLHVHVAGCVRKWREMSSWPRCSSSRPSWASFDRSHRARLCSRSRSAVSGRPSQRLRRIWLARCDPVNSDQVCSQRSAARPVSDYSAMFVS